ncbi:translation termination inhibitor protein itt1 [Ptychographa xylographoides]|nr:translation termination inhibitor protein itt1 [Ptychographa xylographoides]
MADLELADDERAIELSTISAIFPELVIDPSTPFSAYIELPVSPAKPLAVVFVSNNGVATAIGLPTPPGSDDAGNRQEGPELLPPKINEAHLISNLPPLLLKVALPEGYPSTQPPILHLKSHLSWLPNSKLQELEASGRSLWEEMGRDQVLFTYIDHLQQAAEDNFGLNEEGSGLILSHDMEAPLLDFDLKAKKAKFDGETFECGICLEPKKGSVCHRLVLCSHVFCIACLQNFYNACIAEGDVTNVKCLTPNCGKDFQTSKNNQVHQKKRKRKVDLTLDPSELLQIPLAQETVQRYIKLKRKNLLESDKTTVYCPRQWCQGAARSEKVPKPDSQAPTATIDSEDEDEQNQLHDSNSNPDKLPPPSERLAICEDCSFAFCKVCKASWHGEFAVCFPRKQHELSAEEKASEEYLRKHSTACPTCDARCQKTMGCNHMICFKCNSHFCYLCSAWLAEDNPYKHFNTLWTPCYMKLWELEEGDGIGIDREAFRNAYANEEAEGDQNGEEVELFNPAVPVDLEPVALLAQVPRVAPIQPPAPQPPAPEDRIRVNPRAQQGLVRARPPEPIRGPPMQGLQRFLQMVEDDQEDEWDSDELDDDDDAGDRWIIPIR